MLRRRRRDESDVEGKQDARSALAGLWNQAQSAGRLRREACAFDERLELAVGGVARQVLHSAVGRGDKPGSRSVAERTPDPLIDGRGGLHLLGREVEHTEFSSACSYDRMRTQELEVADLHGMTASTVASSWACSRWRGSTRHSSVARTRGGKRPRRRSRSISQSGCAYDPTRLVGMRPFRSIPSDTSHSLRRMRLRALR